MEPQEQDSQDQRLESEIERLNDYQQELEKLSEWQKKEHQRIVAKRNELQRKAKQRMGQANDGQKEVKDVGVQCTIVSSQKPEQKSRGNGTHV